MSPRHFLLLYVTCLFVVTSLYQSVGDAFNPVCFIERPFSALSKRSRSLVQVQTVLPEYQSVLSLEASWKPKDDCTLEISILGHFTLYTLFLELVELRCNTTSEGYISPANVTKVKTGIQNPDPKFPDIPNRWWGESGTVVIVNVAQVNASNVGLYHCFAKHDLFDEKTAININITISVNGCPEGSWGLHCDQSCRCMHGGTCHSWDGSCRCGKSWKGLFCEQENPHVEAVANTDFVYVGDTFNLSCLTYVLNISESNFTWFFQNERLYSGVSSIIISKVNDDHKGEYTCTAVTSDGEVFSDTVVITIIGCRPGKYGKNCDKQCECQNNGTCDRYGTCICSDGSSGTWCNETDCGNRSTSLKNCSDGTDLAPNVGFVVGWTIGGVVLLTTIIIMLVLFLKRQQPCLRITYTSESSTIEEYLRSKDVSELVKDKGQLRTSDLGVLWSHWGLDESCLFVGTQLAEGCFSTVYDGHFMQVGKMYSVAVKILKDEKDEVAWRNFMGEFEILSHVCKHSNIVQMVGLCTKNIFSKVVTCLILENMAAGSLYALLLENRKPKTAHYQLQSHDYVRIVLDIIRGMTYLEKLRYVHRDLAARNVLLNESLVAKISDFGLARDAYSTGEYHQATGRRKALPWKWMAYESIKDNLYTPKSDVWSFGVLLWEISTLGACPYPGVSNEELLAHLDKGCRPEKSPSCSKVWYEAMKICWVVDADARPTFDDLYCFFNDLFTKAKNLSPFNGEVPKFEANQSELTGMSDEKTFEGTQESILMS
ncbi:fibroblast growth factor receptor 3-like [Liolophura sinensis]|uniref:fibroblast growth factor receptor 3-like n=1 Tax=Liolophura sinensis TaxID=3198878 RepID=UPI00315848D3